MDGAGLDAQVLQDGAGVVVGEARGVVVAGKMTQEQVPESRVHELSPWGQPRQRRGKRAIRQKSRRAACYFGSG